MGGGGGLGGAVNRGLCAYLDKYGYLVKSSKTNR